LREIPTSIYALKMLRPGTDVFPFPWLRHCLQDRIISLLQVMHTAKYPESKQATKTVILTYAWKQKPQLHMQRNVEPSAIFFQAFSSVIRSFTGSSSQCFKPQLV